MSTLSNKDPFIDEAKETVKEMLQPTTTLTERQKEIAIGFVEELKNFTNRSTPLDKKSIHCLLGITLGFRIRTEITNKLGKNPTKAQYEAALKEYLQAPKGEVAPGLQKHLVNASGGADMQYPHLNGLVAKTFGFTLVATPKQTVTQPKGHGLRH